MTPATEAGTPSWTDEQIIASVFARQTSFTKSLYDCAIETAQAMRSTYEEELRRKNDYIAAVTQERDLLAHALLIAVDCVGDGGTDKWHLGIADDVELAERIAGRT